MFELARKSAIVGALEKRAKELGFSYGGQLPANSPFTAYTDPAQKKIYIRSNLSKEETALAYAYELQNSVNMEDKYKAIFQQAAQGQLDASSYATGILEIEAEAVIIEVTVSQELAIKGAWDEVQVLVEQHKKGELSQKALQLLVVKMIEERGAVGGMTAREFYEQQYLASYK